MVENHATAGMGAWLQRMVQSYRDGQKHRTAIREATEFAVQVADPVIRQVSRYRSELHKPITGAIAYCESLADAIPGPVKLDTSSYHNNPQVKALFASAEELEDLLRLSPDLGQLRERGQHGEFVALLTMTFQEKTIFGYQQSGETILRDVAQKAVSFSDHRLIASAADLGATRAGIVHRGLEVLATNAMEKITTVRTRKAELREKKTYLQGIMKILGGKNRLQEMFASSSPEQREQYRKAEQALTGVQQELDELREKFATPNDSLTCLKTIMRQPDQSLQMQQQSYRLDWRGVRVDNLPEDEGHSINLVEFSLGEEFRRSAILVNFLQ